MGKQLPILITVFLLLSTCSKILAQSDSAKAIHTETVRGTVIIASSRLPVPRARISIEGTKLGAIASENGEYRILHVPVGHYQVKASCLGYTPSIQEVVVSSGHQTVLNFELTESALQGDTITVRGNNALDPINKALVISSVPFSIQDVNRYAGAFQDPSRMAMNFAGVSGTGTSDNFIVVRGGSPMELQWLLDGIDLPNPNHFGKNGSSGGLISAINSKMLSNSDFLTGAFPAQYGSKMSAVFDLHTRDGNSERIEGTGEINFTGLEAMLEGPIPVSDGSSFLASFRHSTLSVLREVGILDYDQLPDFDDAMLKLSLKLTDRDKLSFTGLWGIASLNVRNTTSDNLAQGSDMVVAGLNWQHIFSDHLITHLLINRTENRYREGVSAGTEHLENDFSTVKLETSIIPNAALTIDAGLSVRREDISYDEPGGYDYTLSFADHTFLYEPYLNSNWHIIPEIVLNAGLFAQFIDYNNSHSYEPRFSLAWSPTDEHTFAAAFGIHRQPEPLLFTQAQHVVLGYTYKPSPDWMVKIEGYQKDYTDAPVDAINKNFFSLLNTSFIPATEYTGLVSTGTGKTYGAELTVLKHYNEGYYITGTLSYVRQEFKGSDNIPHWGNFDNIYIANLLGGYDIPLSTSSVLTLSEKFTITGGSTYTPFDLNASAMEGGEVYDTTKIYGARFDPYIRLDLTAEFKFNWSNSAMTVYASVLNALNTKNILDHFLRFSNDVPEVHNDYDVPIIPVIGVRYEF